MQFDRLPAKVKRAFEDAIRTPKGMGGRERFMRPREVKDLLVLAFTAGQQNIIRKAR